MQRPSDSTVFPINFIFHTRAAFRRLPALIVLVACALAVTVAEGSLSDIAPLAAVSASSENYATGQTAAKAVDGVVDGFSGTPGDYTKEWATLSGKAGSWLRLDWSSAYTVDHLVLHDRPNPNDQVLSGTLQFSDGTSVPVGMLPNDGTGLTVSFTPRTITWLTFTINSVSNATGNIGLSELEVYGSANAAPIITAGPTAAANVIPAGQSVQLTVTASDPNGDPLTYTWQQDGAAAGATGTTVTSAVSSTTISGWTAQPAWDSPSIGKSQRAKPALGDLDGDGRLDMLVGGFSQDTLAFRNVGTANDPVWTAMPAWNVPAMTETFNRPALADLDGDGDLDLLIGTQNHVVAYKNTGSRTAPVWTRYPAWDVTGLTTNRFYAPALADLDGDGKVDMMLGWIMGDTIGYRNTGTAADPVWTPEPQWDVPDVGRFSTPALADLDGDGKVDLLIGESAGSILAYRNTGSDTAPVWTAQPAWDLTDPNASTSDYPGPALGDLNGDGSIDLLYGDVVGVSFAFEYDDGSGLVNQPQVGTITGSGATVTFNAPEVINDTVIRINVTVTDPGGLSATGYVEVTVKSAADGSASDAQLALPPTAIVSPEQLSIAGITATAYDLSSGSVPANAVDGNTQTSWAATSMPQSLTIDLGSLQVVSRVEMLIATAPATTAVSYNLQTSQDDQTWTTAFTGTSVAAAPLWTVAEFSPVYARYVRVNLNAASSGTSVNVYEMAAYGRDVGGTTDPADEVITLSWHPDSVAVDGYIIYFGQSSDDVGTQVTKVVSTSTPDFNPAAPAVEYDSWYDFGLLPGDPVCFKVRAYNSDGVSDFSSPVCSVVKAP